MRIFEELWPLKKMILTNRKHKSKKKKLDESSDHDNEARKVQARSLKSHSSQGSNATCYLFSRFISQSADLGFLSHEIVGHMCDCELSNKHTVQNQQQPQ